MKAKGDKAVASAEPLLTIDVPGAFDGFLEGTSEVQGENGDTPFRLAYKAAEHIRRGPGYTVRLKFGDGDADEILSVLRMYAESCIDSNGDQMHERGMRSQVTAARKVLTRCDELTAELKAVRAVPETTWRAEPRGDGFVVTNGTEFITGTYTSEPHVYKTQKDAEWFAWRRTAHAKDRELWPTFWLTVLDGMEVRWFSTDKPAYRAVVSIVDLKSRKPARMIDVDYVDETERVVLLAERPLGYTLFARYVGASPSFDRFVEKFPHYAYLVQGISEGRGVTGELQRIGLDSEGLQS